MSISRFYNNTSTTGVVTSDAVEPVKPTVADNDIVDAWTASVAKAGNSQPQQQKNPSNVDEVDPFEIMVRASEEAKKKILGL